jgi:hypothetical protein
MSDYLTPDPREARQPQWIRNTLDQLRMRLGEARRRVAELTDGPADSDTIADPYGDFPQRLKRGESIEFHLGTARTGEPMTVRVRVIRDRNGRAVLDINANDTLLVLPRASNAIELEVRER